MALFPHIRHLQTHNLTTLRRSPISEISGSLGDLGTLLPLMIALTLTHSISLSSTLVFSGLANILTGILFGIPLPVQPMKAIAAVAISNSFSKAQTASAGLFVAGVIFVLSATGLLRWFGRVIPIPVVKGIQVGAGLSLILSAGSSQLQHLGWLDPSWADNLLWAIAAFVFLLLSIRLPTLPYALLVLILGLVFSGVRTDVSTPSTPEPGLRIWHPHTLVPKPSDFRVGALDAGLGQLPLTTLNSIIAVSHLSADLLPDLPTPSVTSLGFSVAVANLVGCWFGAMPVCHGSGGLAAQYRFGARSGASIIFLGTIKLLLGLFVGDGLVRLLQGFPRALLGIMVLAAGVELCKVGESLNAGARDLWEDAERNDGQDDEVSQFRGKSAREPSEEERKERWMVMLMTIAGLLAFRNDAVGFIAGILCHWTYHWPATPQIWSRDERLGNLSQSWLGLPRRRRQDARHVEEGERLIEPDD
ncbi:MAG: hypothetical protein M1820_009851 [Bogoriella megaspora]|nr:MAG: hypothetical protein M1820_009851 [Bogoriella megaspora]